MRGRGKPVMKAQQKPTAHERETEPAQQASNDAALRKSHVPAHLAVSVSKRYDSALPVDEKSRATGVISQNYTDRRNQACMDSLTTLLRPTAKRHP